MMTASHLLDRSLWCRRTAGMGQKRSIFPRGIDEALGVDSRPSLAARNHGPLPEALPFFPWAGTLRRSTLSARMWAASRLVTKSTSSRPSR
jgi:hypothetical protein